MILHACNKISFVKFAVLYLFFAPTFLNVVQGNDSNSKTDLKHNAAADSSFESDSIAMRKKAAQHSKSYDQVARHDPHQSIIRRNTDNSFDPKSTTITNNIVWKDNNGNPLKNGRGGKIAKIDRVWYWVGSEPAVSGEGGGNIYLYKSKSLGSNSWEFVRKLDLVADGLDSRNCQIFKHPKLKTIHIFCSHAKFFTLEAGGSMKEGDFSLVRRGDPSNLDKKEWKWGNQNMFAIKGIMYMSVSRRRKWSQEGQVTTTRKAVIYKLNDSWTDFADENVIVAEWYWPHREAFHVIKRNRRWFIFASETQRWRQSKTWYRESKEGLTGLATAPDKEVVMHPSNTVGIKSMGTQFRFMQKVGRGKWLFGGSRHPHEDPDNFDPKYGIHVLVPMKFKEGILHVYWKETFNLKTYDYKSEDYDQHNVEWYGPAAA